MVAITIAISATVYAYVSGLISTSASSDVVPQLQFMKQGTSLIVSKCPSGLTWADVSIQGTHTAKTGTDPVTVGSSVTGCDGQVTISMDGELIGVYNFE